MPTVGKATMAFFSMLEYSSNQRSLNMLWQDKSWPLKPLLGGRLCHGSQDHNIKHLMPDTWHP